MLTAPRRSPSRDMTTAKRKQTGISIIELMVSLVIGLLVTGALVAVFSSTSRSFQDLKKSRDQIENGRFALEVLSEEIRHAGFFGQLANFTAPAAAVDPCISPALADLFYPVQVYSTSLVAKVTPLPSCLASAEVRAGSDILVIRRTETFPLGATDIAVSDQPYVQSNPGQGAIQLGGGVAVGTTLAATGSATSIFNKDGVTAAPIHKLNIRIYYVSPCSQTTCGATGGDGVPTLKRIELTKGGASPVWSAPVPLVSGIELMQLDLGADTSPTTVSTVTGLRGDGSADGDFTATLPAGSDWNEVVSIRINLLSRTLETVVGYSDTGRTYALGTAGTVAGSGAYKRQVFSSEVRMNNVAGRRETDPRDNT